MKLGGSNRGRLQEGLEGLSGSSPLRSDGSHDSQAGETGPCKWWPKTHKCKSEDDFMQSKDLQKQAE